MPLTRLLAPQFQDDVPGLPDFCGAARPCGRIPRRQDSPVSEESPQFVDVFLLSRHPGICSLAAGTKELGRGVRMSCSRQGELASRPTRARAAAGANCHHKLQLVGRSLALGI